MAQVELGRRSSTMPPTTIKDMQNEIRTLEGLKERNMSLSDLPVKRPIVAPALVEVTIVEAPVDPSMGAKDLTIGSTDITQELKSTPIDIPLVKRLAYLRPMAINIPNSAGITAMHAVCIYVREYVAQQDVLLWFLKRGGNLSMCDADGHTALELLDIMEPDTQLRSNVHNALQRYTRSVFNIAAQHPALAIAGVAESHSTVSLHTPCCVHPTAALYCLNATRDVVLREVATSTVVLTVFAAGPRNDPEVHTVVAAPFPAKRVEWKRYANADTGSTRDDTCELAWSDLGDLALLRGVGSTFQNTFHCESIATGVSFFKFEKSTYHRRGSRLAACVITGPMPTFAFVQRDTVSNALAFVAVQLTYKLTTTSMPDLIVAALANIRDGKMTNVSKATMPLPTAFEPACVSYVGNGNFVLLSSAGDMHVYNCETQSFVSASISSKNTEKVVACCGFASSSLMERFDFVDSYKPLSLMCIVRERTVEICRLSVADPSRRGKTIKTVRLIMRIPNTRTGGSFTACVHPTLNQFLLVRAATVSTECSAIDVENNVVRLICSIEKYPELGEANLFHIVPMMSPDGTLFYRRNMDSDLCVAHAWGHMVAFSNPEVTWPFAATASMMKPLVHLRETPPDGELTMVFTDLQSSTFLWDAVKSMSEGVALHFVVMRRLMARFRGYEVKNEGDAFMVSFKDPLDAFNWCLAVQLCHLVVGWEDDLLEVDPCTPSANTPQEMDDDTLFYYRDITTLILSDVDDDVVVTEDMLRWVWRGFRVRMGMHVCSPLTHLDPVSRRMDYMGPTVNLSARIASSAFGGEIVMSQEAHDAVGICSGTRFAKRGKAICPVIVNELGTFQLKGIKHPKTIYQFLPTILATRFEEFQANREEAIEKELDEGKEATFIQSPRNKHRTNFFGETQGERSPRSPSRSPRSPVRRKLLRESSFMGQGEPLMNSAKYKAPVEIAVENGEVTSGHDDVSENGSSPDDSRAQSFISSLVGKCTKCKHAFRTTKARFCQMCGTRRGIVLP